MLCYSDSRNGPHIRVYKTEEIQRMMHDKSTKLNHLYFYILSKARMAMVSKALMVPLKAEQFLQGNIKLKELIMFINKKWK